MLIYFTGLTCRPPPTLPPHPKLSLYDHILHSSALPPSSLPVLMVSFWVLPWGDVVCMLLTVTKTRIVPP